MKAIQDTFKQEGAAWVSAADAAAESDPIGAYDLYAKTTATFRCRRHRQDGNESDEETGGGKIGQGGAGRARRLRQVGESISTQPPPLAGAATVFADIAKKHVGTPTAEKAQGLAEELGYKAPAKKK